eukprot:GEMP01062047.1.p1 GENE.GEMP01062047.1~~GEMP01062047.1.p1  ORF type:complete len:200 (+),score=40.77 GEMP01062047.1:43-642(+)
MARIPMTRKTRRLNVIWRWAKKKHAREARQQRSIPTDIQHFCFVDVAARTPSSSSKSKPLDEETTKPAPVRRQPTRYYEDPTLRRDISCYLCWGSHLAKDCPSRACYRCNEVGHMAYDCPQYLCHRCQEHGHYARECPYFSKGKGSKGKGSKEGKKGEKGDKGEERKDEKGNGGKNSKGGGKGKKGGGKEPEKELKFVT